MRRLALLVGLLALPACTGGFIPGLGGLSGGPTVVGNVAGGGAGWRVGLIGTSPALELTSAALSGTTFTLSFPASPGAAGMEQPAETQSIVFTLRAYLDANGNGRSDAGEKQGGSAGSFRYFATNGPAGTYRAGWNQYRGGVYSQAFDAAFAL